MSKKAKGNASLSVLEEAFFQRKDLPGTIDLNYCIPLNIGIISQHAYSVTAETQASIRSALTQFVKQMQDLFGTSVGVQAPVRERNRTRIQYNLLVSQDDRNSLSKFAANYLKGALKAEETIVESYEEMKKRSWVVLALWDGIPGGTAFEAITTILCYRPDPELSKPEHYTMSLPENRPVFQILLPVEDENRIDHAQEKKLRNFTIRDIYPRALERLENNTIWFDRYHYAESGNNNERRANFAKSAKRIRFFNNAVIRYVNNHYTSVRNGWQLLGTTRKRGITTSISADMAEMRQICYDAISMKAQSGYKRELWSIFLFAVLGLGCFAVYSDLAAIKIFYFAFFILFVLAYLLLLILKKHDNQGCYLEFRAIAESMRVQCYWHMAGIEKSTGTIYAARFSKDMSWAKYALNRWFEQDTGKEFPDVNRAARNQTDIENALRNDFLDSQRAFFHKKITDAGGKKDNFKRIVSRQNALLTLFKILWIVFGISLTVVLFFNLSSEWPFDTSFAAFKGSSIIDVLVFGMSAANVLALGASYFSEKLLYRILVSRYTYCKLLAEKALYDYDHGTVPKKNVFEKYGEQALAENAEWLLIENDLEPDVPNG